MPHITGMLNHAATSGSFPKETLQMTNHGLSKPNKETSIFGNCQPISLLNTYMAIYTEALASILLNTLLEFIDSA